MAENYDENMPAEEATRVEGIAAALRAPVQLDPSFEGRLMEKARMEGAVLYPVRAHARGSWWRTERVFRLSPLTGLALAAGVSAVIALSGVAIGSRISSRSSNVSRTALSPVSRDTVQLVRFVFVDPRASSVHLVGDFNAWTKGATRLDPSGAPGVWAVSVELSPGRHEYAFIINGSRWVADPLAVRSSDDFGTESSVIRVGASPESAT
jgi:hypothetical protein